MWNAEKENAIHTSKDEKPPTEETLPTIPNKRKATHRAAPAKTQYLKTTASHRRPPTFGGKAGP